MARNACPVPAMPLIATPPREGRFTRVVVGQSPGPFEHLFDVPFMGAAGAFLRLRLQALLGNDQETVFLTNALDLCPDCREFPKPTDAEWKKMLDEPRNQKRLAADIASCTPSAILALGREALYAVTGNWTSQGKLGAEVGKWRYTGARGVRSVRDPGHAGVPPDLHLDEASALSSMADARSQLVERLDVCRLPGASASQG